MGTAGMPATHPTAAVTIVNLMEISSITLSELASSANLEFKGVLNEADMLDVDISLHQSNIEDAILDLIR